MKKRQNKLLATAFFISILISSIVIPSVAQNVGIGTQTPVNTLHVRSDSMPTILVEATGVANSYDATLQLKTNGGVYDYFEFKKNSALASGTIGGVAIANASTLFAGASASRLMLGTLNNEHTHFFTNAIERMRLTNDGYLCLGTINNPGKLSILYNSTATRPTIDLKETGLDYARINFGSTEIGSKYWAIAGMGTPTTANDRLNFWYSTYGDIMSIAGTGEVGIGKTPTHAGSVTDALLQVKGVSTNDILRLENPTGAHAWGSFIHASFGDLTIYYNGAYKGAFSSVNGNYVAASDRRVKKDITPLNNTLNLIKTLTPYKYRYIDNPENSPYTYGFVAQDVQKLFPDLVKEREQRDGKNLLTLDYTGLHAVAFKAIQEQEDKIEKLGAIIQKMQEEIEALKKR